MLNSEIICIHLNESEVFQEENAKPCGPDSGKGFEEGNHLTFAVSELKIRV